MAVLWGYKMVDSLVYYLAAMMGSWTDGYWADSTDKKSVATWEYSMADKRVHLMAVLLG